MKSSLKMLFAAAASAAICSTVGNISAQVIMAGWASNGEVNGGGTTNFYATQSNPNVTVGPLMKGSGIGAITTAGVFGGNNWTNGVAGLADSEPNSISNGYYITYTVQANPGYTVSFTTNVLFWHNSATGPINGELQYSTDGINYTDVVPMTYSATHAAQTSSLTNVLAGNSALQNVPSTTTNYFRIVNWGATGTAGTWYINNASPVTMPDFQVIGVVTPLPPAENVATWYAGALTAGGGAPPAPFTNNTADPNVIVTPFMKATTSPGIGAITTAGVYGGNDWTNAGVADSEASSITNGYYITYAVQALPGYTVSFYTNVLFYHNSATGPINGELQYSTDGINYANVVPMTYASSSVAETLVMTNNLSGFNFLQNVPATTTNFFRIVNWGATGTGGTWYIDSPTPGGTLAGTNNFVVVGGVFSIFGIVPPTNVVVSPSSIVANAGQTVGFTVSSTGSPASNFWYQIVGSTTNLISYATSSTLTLTNILGANSGSYFVILTNSAGSATSALVSLTVIDPVIQAEPSSAQGVVNGTVQFAVTAAGTSPTYQWYFSDASGDILAPAASPGDGSIISGANSSVLTYANLQAYDLSNFVVVVTNLYGAVTSTVASVSAGTNFVVIGGNNVPALPYFSGVLAFWDFDGMQFTNTAVNPNSINDPVPFIGSGAAFAVGSAYDPGTSPFSGATDPDDVAGVFSPYGFSQLSPNFSWGTDNYPALTGTNLQNGVQFNVSTVGAKNIIITYDARATQTASEYHRLQYTTNGTTWINYPASSSFNGNISTYGSFQYSLVGFPGVDNNPNFGIRIVTEWQSTATYQTAASAASNTNTIGANGVVATNFWVGVGESVATGNSGNASGGTFTFDVVAFQGDSITNNNTPPVLGAFANMPVTNNLAFTNMLDTTNLLINFTASSAQMAATNLTFTVQPVNTVITGGGSYNQTVNPNFTVTNAGSTNFVLSISFSAPTPDSIDAAPILVTATDTNGESASSWFLLTSLSANQPPTNTLTALQATNMLANTSITIPFVASGSADGTTNLSFTITSDNNTLIPVGNVVVGGNTNTGNFTLTVTPAADQVGNAVITVAVIDSNPAQTRTTTSSTAFIVRPNTNSVAVDEFDYDNSGALDQVALGYWSHLSGNGGMQVGNDTVTISDESTKNLQAQLLNGPYRTNSGTVLYSSFTVNIESTANLPGNTGNGNGSYIVMFNDGSGTTANVEDCLVVATNNAAPGFYRLGISSVVGADATTAQMVPEDLAPGVTYFVVTSLKLSNGFSTLWISPTNQSSFSVTDTTPPATPTNLYNIADIELRQSGVDEGIVNVGSLFVGTSFNSVFYPPQANPVTVGITENTTNVLSPLFNDAGWALSITGLTPDGNETAAVTSGTNITVIPTSDFIGTAVVGYTIEDNLGNTSSSTVTLTVTNWPPLANPVTYYVSENSANNVLNPLANDVLETPGGSLSLVSVSPTNGTASISGSSVLFTPPASFLGTATIGYTITDNVGGTNTSLITVGVEPTNSLPINAALVNNNIVLSWTNPLFNLQFSTNVVGPYAAVPGASSPYTNLIGTNTTGFFRLAH